jgi:AraC family transcriptional activator of pobA
MEKENIREYNLEDIPKVLSHVKYFDGDIYFADNITSIPDLRKAFKVNFISVAFCLEGTVEVQLDFNTYRLHQNDGLLVGSNSIVNILDYSNKDFKCIIFGVTANLGFNFINKSIFDALMEVHSHPLLKFTEEEITMMIKYYDLAMYKMDHPNLNYGRETMTGLFRLYAYDMLSSINGHIDTEDNRMLRQGDKLFRRFVMLLADNHENERRVKKFANQLCISPKYLTSVCTQQTGKSASELIATSITSRIRQMLLYSEKSIKEVAVDMNFDNLSFFGKYVKKHLGTSPNNFRKLNGYGK